MKTTIKTLRVRVKDKHAKLLRKMAFEVNQVWNAVNAFTDENCYVPIPPVGWVRVPYSAFDLAKTFKTIRTERGLNLIGSATVQEITESHAKARKQFKKDKLKWRCSGGARRSLGWVPFKSRQLIWRNSQAVLFNHHFGVFDSYGLGQFEFRSGSFSEDSRGRWYLNVCVKIEIQPCSGTGQVGIDLGLKTTATCSDGNTLERGEWYRSAEKKLAIAQRAKNKKRVRAIHAKVKNCRADANHKFSRKIVNENALIVIGNVSASGLAKTNMAKSVLDAGWFQLKTMLDYKSIRMQVEFLEVNEKNTTQTCSSCGTLPNSRPKGIAGLGIREWTCSECGAEHDRDINAAKNILALGHERLAVGIPCL